MNIWIMEVYMEVDGNQFDNQRQTVEGPVFRNYA